MPLSICVVARCAITYLRGVSVLSLWVWCHYGLILICVVLAIIGMCDGKMCCHLIAWCMTHCVRGVTYYGLTLCLCGTLYVWWLEVVWYSLYIMRGVDPYLRGVSLC